MPMNPTVKAKWLQALRSGKYEQARGSLQTIVYRDNETGQIDCGYCCLGVLCDIAAQEDVCYWEGHGVNTFEGGVHFFEDEKLPPSVADWAGLPRLDPEVLFTHKGVGHMERLSVLNDRDRLNFSQIADIIEEQL